MGGRTALNIHATGASRTGTVHSGWPSEDDDAACATAHGWARTYCHHGEILQGVFVVGAALRRGLVSLPCRLYHTEATAELRSDGVWQVDPAWKTKSAEAARLTLSALGLHGFGALLRIESTVPVSRGFGSSTSDVTAVVHAVASAAHRHLSDGEVARLAVRAEVASDALMFDRPVLFAQREAVIIEDFCADLLDLHVLGFSTPRADDRVDTLRFPPARYDAWEIESFRAMRGLLRRGLVRRDARAVGAVATASARANQRHLPVHRFAELEALVADVGAVGLQVAHTGDIAGLLFDLRDERLTARLCDAEPALRELGFTDTWHFRSGETGRWTTPDAAATGRRHQR